MDNHKRGFESWRADLGWKILRLSPKYQLCVKEFIAMAEYLDDGGSLSEIRRFSVEESSTDNEHLLDLPLKNTLDILHDSPHLKNFQLNFGEVIRYPILPETENPRRIFLNALWNLKPATLIDDLYLDYVKTERAAWPSERWQIGPLSYFNAYKPLDPDANSIFRMVYLNLEINTSFSDDAIVKEANRALREILKHIRESKHHSLGEYGKNVRWNEVDECVKVWKIKNENPNLGNLAIGKLVFPKLNADLQKQTVKNRLITMANLISTIELLGGRPGKTPEDLKPITANDFSK